MRCPLCETLMLCECEPLHRFDADPPWFWHCVACRYKLLIQKPEEEQYA